MNLPPPREYRLHASPTMRAVLWACGVVALIFGVVGIIVPGLPTTPFVLIAGACFIRASPRAHTWLLRNRTFGPILAEWEQHHSIPRRVKRFALAAMVLTACFSVWFFSDRPGLQVMVLVGVSLGTATVLWLPSRD